ncbi:MAG: PD40 domain-containing protein [Flavobacteriaceae bacterium]|nr:PD40 domain-containing protein [Flavobacteriaceae bacterium]
MKYTIVLFLLSFVSSVINGQTPSQVLPVFETLGQFSNTRDIAISSVGNEAFITVQSPLGEVSVLVQIQLINGEWKAQEILSFSGMYQDMEPFLSANNLTLYFASNRPLSMSDTAVKDFDIWKVERTSLFSPWGNPINLGKPINTEYNEFYPSLSANNTLYFTSDQPSEFGKDNVWFSEKDKHGYKIPRTLPKAINSDGYEFNAFIASDESYLIFSGYKREKGFGSGDLYISFKTENDTWTEARNIGGEINSKYMDYCPFVDQKTNTLYFTSKRSDFKNNRNFRSLETLMRALNKNENGQSRGYKVAMKNILLMKNEY